MKHLRLFLMVAASLAIAFPAFSQEISRERQQAEADSLFAGYDFADAAANTATYVEEVMNALGEAADDRFKTE